MSMTPEDIEKTKAAVEDFVELRNQLVHHLIDRFDVWTGKGCVDAVRHLEESYVRIDRRSLELTQWAKSMDEARRMTAQFTQTPMFHDLLVDGIAHGRLGSC